MLPGPPLDGSSLISKSSRNPSKTKKGHPQAWGALFSFSNSSTVEFFGSRGTRERSRLQISVELRQRFRHILSSIAKSDMSRLVVNRSREQQHACIANQILAPAVNILLRLEPRKSDGGGIRRSPIENIAVAGEERRE